MKNLFFSLVTVSLFCINAKAQITLEHSYSGTDSIGGNGWSEFSLIKLDNTHYNWALVDYFGARINLYNFNHSLNKSISIPRTWTGNRNTYKVKYITTSLFDCDSTNIEYMLAYQGAPGYVNIYREDGTVIFSEDSTLVDATSFTMDGENLPTIQVVNTPVGAKMYLVSSSTGNINVYSLCGKVPSAIKYIEPNAYSLNAFPNPSQSITTIEYKLPENIQTAELTFYNLEGMEVKKMKIDKNFTNVLISTEDLPTGSYLYTLTAQNKLLQTKKLVVIK